VAIYVALGANLPSPAGAPAETLTAALAALGREGVRPVAVSRFYRSPAEPPSGQPDFVNAVARVETALGPAALLECLHAVEAAFGRARGAANAARTLDLDLLDWHGVVSGGSPVLPHPRLQGRGFVLVPLAEIAPDWRHPVSRRSIGELVSALPLAAMPSPLAGAQGRRR
jgi:2-amino-4-hydroxy-6-hydroxymethyldihydropteridine diphosphokinase